MCVYVCIQDCVYVRGFLCVCVYSHMWRLGMILGGAVTPQLPSTLFYFEKGCLFCLEVTIRLGWMVSELQESTGSCLTRAGITSTRHHTQHASQELGLQARTTTHNIFAWVLALSSCPSGCMLSTVLAQLPLQTQERFLTWIMKLFLNLNSTFTLHFAFQTSVF